MKQQIIETMKQQMREQTKDQIADWLEQIQIEPADESAIEQCKQQWFHICKPLGSLGELENLVIRMAGMMQTHQVKLEKRAAMIVCGDNGVVKEQISQSDHEVTSSVALQIADGKSNINVMARQANVDVYVADVGMKNNVSHKKIIQKKVANGTGNILHEPAMSINQTMQAIIAGMELAKECREMGYQILITGEMGIGNTTTSSAMASALLGLSAENVTGPGAGLTNQALQHKMQVVQEAVDRIRGERDAFIILQQLGGYDIAAMVGLFFGGAMCHMPVVIDGLISSVAALVAYRLKPESRDYMIASHMTEEPAGERIMKELGLYPVIRANMRLGEGTGAVCLMPILDIALAEYNHAHRFSETAIEQYEVLS